MIDTILFDNDGVIMNSFEQGFRLAQHIMRYHNKPEVSEEAYRRGIGNWKSLYRSLGFSDSEIAGFPALFASDVKGVYENSTIFSGIAQVLAAAHEKYKTAVASSGVRELLVPVFERHGILQHIDYFSGQEDTNGRLKPDPYQLLLCMETLNASPGNTCFVCDTAEDVKAGKDAEALVIAVTYGFHRREWLEEADILVDSPQELLAALEAL